LRLAAALLLLQAAAGEYVGSRVCAGCHPAQSRTQARSEHALALARASAHHLFPVWPAKHVAYRPPDFRLTWLRNEVVVWDGSTEVRLPVTWAFGAGQQAVTFVSRLDDDRYVEHHLSYYTGTKSLGLTPGHRPAAAVSSMDAVGVAYRTFAADSAILRCFQCHSTGPLRLMADFGIEPFEPGVQCESCHGPGERHLSAKTGIFNPARLSASEMSVFCGNCHRPPASDASTVDFDDPWNIRHQPLYLVRSACALKSQLRCTTCHDPHASLETSAVAYNARCASCHPQTGHSSAERNCVECHMPKVRPQPNLAFTNHWIGVFDRGSKLRPRH
jgi:Zn finger protein HypA/HybF involved in hydrogenase expression